MKKAFFILVLFIGLKSDCQEIVVDSIFDMSNDILTYQIKPNRSSLMLDYSVSYSDTFITITPKLKGDDGLIYKEWTTIIIKDNSYLLEKDDGSKRSIPSFSEWLLNYMDRNGINSAGIAFLKTIYEDLP